MTDAQATALGLVPMAVGGDTDGDGIPDANEIGDHANPTDSDGDGVIASVPVATGSSGSGGGGCALGSNTGKQDPLMPALMLTAVVSLLRLKRRPGSAKR